MPHIDLTLWISFSKIAKPKSPNLSFKFAASIIFAGLMLNRQMGTPYARCLSSSIVAKFRPAAVNNTAPRVR